MKIQLNLIFINLVKEREDPEGLPVSRLGIRILFINLRKNAQIIHPPKTRSERVIPFQQRAIRGDLENRAAYGVPRFHAFAKRKWREHGVRHGSI